jgi:hypothetical protein
MVTYGPWQESRIHEELFTLKDSPDVDPEKIVLLGEAPTVRSGWDANNLAALAWHAIGTGSGDYEQPLSNPPEAKAELSEAGFAAMLSDLVGNGGTMQHRLHQHGAQLRIGTAWRQSQTWEARGEGYRLWYDRDLESNTGQARYAVPADFEYDDDAFYLELETLGTYRPLEIVDATVLASPPMSNYRLYVKDVHLTDAEPFLRSAVAEGGPASSIEQGRMFPDAGSNLPLDHFVLNELIVNGVPVNGEDWSGDGRMPTLAVLYDGPDLSVATLNGDVGYDVTHTGQPVRIRIRYRWPRWRKVFYEPQTVPVRRLTQRGDGLAGGAPRTGGHVKTIQRSNRRGAGSIV